MSIDEKKQIRILTELDALLDTRLGLMDKLDPDSAVRLVDNPDYFTREEDKFEPLCGFPDELFQDEWAKRNIEVLKHSFICPSVNMLHGKVWAIEKDAVQNPEVDIVVMDINIYPYRLNKEEIIAIQQAVTDRIGANLKTNVLYEPASTFTPQYVKGLYDAMVFYDHNAWFKAHSDALFASNGIPQVTIAGPKLAYESMPNRKEFNFAEYGLDPDLDIFDFASHAAIQYINLEFIPVETFCIAHPAVD